LVAGETVLGDVVAATVARTAAGPVVRGSAASFVAVAATRCWLMASEVCI